MIEQRALVQSIRIALIAVPALLAIALVYAKSPRIDPRVLGDWYGNAGGDPRLTLGPSGRYVSMNLTQTKTIPPEVGTYAVLSLQGRRANGRFAGAETVRLRHVLPDDVARTLHRDPVVIRDLTFVPGLPALLEGDRSFVLAKDNEPKRDRLARWRRLP